ncbi:hypothetical protein DXC92_19600 [Clostridiales bacterium TF09-2AC]|nr:hypothetical protein DXC92_19600 [Clostridiales bacterium TF09-2AC]
MDVIPSRNAVTVFRGVFYCRKMFLQENILIGKCSCRKMSRNRMSLARYKIIKPIQRQIAGQNVPV